jgi:hypothetical protein
MQEAMGGNQLVAGADPGGVEHQRVEALVGARRVRVPDPGRQPGGGRRGAHALVHLGEHVGVDRAQDRGQLADQPAARGAEQDGTRDHRPPGTVALQLRRLGQSDLSGDEPADRSVDELLIAVRHGRPP